MKDLNLLYYPYSRCLDSNTLKKALLLFDSVTFADSQPDFMRNQIINQKTDKETDILESDIDYLQSEELVKIFNPIPLIKDYDLILSASTYNDIRDDDFCKLSLKESSEVWSVLSERLPPSFKEFFYAGAGTFSEAICLQALIHSKGNSEELPKRLREFSSWRFSNLTPEEAWQSFSDRYRYVIGGNPHIDLPAYEMPFLQASSLRINESLLIASIEKLIPFTDSGIHKSLMGLKVERVIKGLDEIGKDIGQELKPKLHAGLPKQSLAMSIMEELIPEECIREKTVKDIIYYKRKNQKILNQFRLKVNELSWLLCEDEFNGDELQIQKILDTKILPDINKYKTELRTNWEDSFGKLLIRSSGIIIPTISLSIAAGLGTAGILGACALAELGYLTTKGTDDLLKSWRGLQKKSSGDYSYLLNFT